MTQSLNVRKFAGFAFVAAIVNSIIFLIAKGADATMVVNQGGAQEIALPMVLASTLFGLIVAAVIANQIGKKSQAFISKSPIIGLVFGVVTAAAPFVASDDSKTALALATMHILAGVTWYLGSKQSTK
jgi:flagellar biosynthesis protein FliQ